MALVRSITPKNLDAQSDDEIAAASSTRMKSIILSQLTNRINTKEAASSKKRKNTSLLKQTDRFTSHTDPIRHMERGVQMLEEAKTHLLENEASLLEQAITLINHALAHTQPEPSPSPSPSPSLEEKFAIFTTSLNERLGRMEATLASGSPIGSQASQSGSTNIPMSYATAASYRGSTTSSDDRTNATVQPPIGNQTKATPPRKFIDQRVILIGSNNTEWQKDVKATRDRLNVELKKRLHTQHSVIASITKTAYSQNIVLVATQHFTAQDLMDNTDVIQSTFAYQRIQKDVQWFKTMVHGVAISDFDTTTGMSEL
jgi:hypothetical protein